MEIMKDLAQAMSNNCVVTLLSPNATDTSLFGAKTANLAKAAQLGFNVPEGLAFSRMCSENLISLLAQEAIDKLSPPVAVRSSSTKEDSNIKAFAGQFETRLGIVSAADLKDAFSLVKNSGSSEHIIKYNGEVIAPEQIAVLVQRMVDATRAGVAFSRDPVTGESKVIIDSNYGLGKSVVDGDVTPDSIESLKDGTCNIFIGRKSTQFILSENGVQKHNTSLPDTKRCSLTNEEIMRIVELAQKVEYSFGFAADIEWALDTKGILWLLQARPITTI